MIFCNVGNPPQALSMIYKYITYRAKEQFKKWFSKWDMCILIEPRICYDDKCFMISFDDFNWLVKYFDECFMRIWYDYTSVKLCFMKLMLIATWEWK